MRRSCPSVHFALSAHVRTMKTRMGATHFLCKTLPKVATEMALCVLTYNLTRVLHIVGVEKMIEAITA